MASPPTSPAAFRFRSALLAFAPLFRARVWERAQLLLLGAILAPGPRTACSVLRVMGLEAEAHFQNDPRVRNRARWSSRAARRVLLGLLIQAFAPSGPIRVGFDDTVERRWGRKIQARGIDRDPVRSSRSHFVKTSGWRWLSLMLVAQIPWAGRVWALPFLTVLAPSRRYGQKWQRRHKTGPDWGRQMLLRNSGAGCPIARSSWWLIAAMQRSNFSEAWQIGDERSPALPGCVWTPNFMLLPPLATQGKSV